MGTDMACLFRRPYRSLGGGSRDPSPGSFWPLPGFSFPRPCLGGSLGLRDPPPVPCPHPFSPRGALWDIHLPV